MTFSVDTFDVDAFDADFAALDPDLYELITLEANLSSEAQDMLSALDADMEAAGFGADAGTMDLNSLADNAVEAAFVSNLLKSRAAKLIKRLYEYIRRIGSNCTSCVNLVRQAVQAFRDKKYARAIYIAGRAILCIRKCTTK
ncbi:hypothetical protein [Nodosilinea sp. P-1105]|uniref:hypothetical protein n=1 Tax=Nodosilinea sp. P-1105 TaxID=2546229 RepID=UPI00146DD257|nr:hypothetical protein [Nodosilinea sp. P-1105]NMF81997.1 hypothetical protein [Nodosilinea sp. P-1105]